MFSVTPGFFFAIKLIASCTRIIIWTTPAVTAWELTFGFQVSSEISVDIRVALAGDDTPFQFWIVPLPFRAL
jgi:hypothetical protein